MQSLTDKNNKILVTGGYGFLGQRIISLLKKNGYKKVFHFTKNDFDISNEIEAKKLFHMIKPNIVINCAALVGGINFCRKFPGTIFMKNMQIQINTLNFSWLYNVKKLINIGSACIYSDKNKTPFVESDFDKRSMHPSVLNYGFSKLTQIYGSLALSKEFGFNSINLLPANLY